ncbi:MAG: hypothetical protein V3U33_02475 [candidate division NC10 bacterium]
MSVGRLWILVGLGGAVLAAFLVAFVVLPMILGPANVVPITTIEQGPLSTVRRNGDFPEACTVARSTEEWASLWTEHNRGFFSTPLLPEVDFEREIVLGCFLGLQPSCCEAQVTIVSIQVTEMGYEVSVDRDYTQVDSESLSLPFHFVRVPRTEGSITFIDAGTGENIPVVNAIEVTASP